MFCANAICSSLEARVGFPGVILIHLLNEVGYYLRVFRV